MNTVSEGWNTNNAQMAAVCFTDDAIYSEPPDKLTFNGRDALYEFFGGDEGRDQPMQMIWHHLIYNKETQIGTGEWTFKYAGTISHGVVIVRIEKGLISNWREYYYESDLDWEDFIAKNPF